MLSAFQMLGFCVCAVSVLSQLIGGSAEDLTCSGASCEQTDSLVQVKSHLQQQQHHEYGPYRVRSALQYFQHWANGLVEDRLQRQIHPEGVVFTEAETAREQLTAAGVVSMLGSQQSVQCPEIGPTAHWSVHKQGTPSASERWVVHEIGGTRNGVEHVLLRSPEGGFQYVAHKSGVVLAADPPACPTQRTSKLLQEAPVPETPEVSEAPETPSGGSAQLAADDPMVVDCLRLVRRTVSDNCGGNDIQVNFMNANQQVIDGLKVRMNVKVVGKKHGMEFFHQPQCLFETAPSPDANLVQMPRVVILDDVSGALPEEKSGMRATLMTGSDICNLDKEPGVDADTAADLSLLEDFAFGELSLYKGFEHVDANLPRIDLVQMLDAGAVPDAFDLRTRYPDCYPQTASEVVRNQGQCGSCWAFASASTTMNNLCMSDSLGDASASLADPTDRFEVSVQQIMSCNAAHRGCSGGNAANTDSAFKAAEGIGKERDFMYTCGAGDPQNHFQSTNTDCSTYPWGGTTCSQSVVNNQWFWGGVATISGAQNIEQLLAAGFSVYVTLDVYANFMKLAKGTIFTSSQGAKQGGHAVTAVAYGSDGGTAYWTLQNSWGTHWADGGYGRMLRGTNLCGIETDAKYFRAWVAGGSVPPCQNGVSTGLQSGGVPIPCSDAKIGAWGNLCNRPTVMANCPVVCGDPSCAVAPTPPPGPTPRPQTPAPTAPTPSPTAMPTSPPPACQKGPSYCAKYSRYCGNVNVRLNGKMVDELCPVVCGHCQPDPNACADKEHFCSTISHSNCGSPITINYSDGTTAELQITTSCPRLCGVCT